jgi:Protein of unknown function (DUF1580)
VPSTEDPPVVGDAANKSSTSALFDETLVPLKAACRLIPGRSGKGIAVTTIYRWALRGCRGTRLQTAMIGGQRYTSHEALDRFVIAINRRPSSQISPIGRERQHRVEAALDSEGL